MSAMLQIYGGVLHYYWDCLNKIDIIRHHYSSISCTTPIVTGGLFLYIVYFLIQNSKISKKWRLCAKNASIFELTLRSLTFQKPKSCCAATEIAFNSGRVRSEGSTSCSSVFQALIVGRYCFYRRGSLLGASSFLFTQLPLTLIVPTNHRISGRFVLWKRCRNRDFLFTLAISPNRVILDLSH